MKILEKEFKYKKFKFKQLIREDNKAIYLVSSIEGKSKSFEVVKIRSHNGYEIQGVQIPPSEVYPSTTQWGLYGWTYTTEEDARKKFLSI